MIINKLYYWGSIILEYTYTDSECALVMRMDWVRLMLHKRGSREEGDSV
jgi:hypothetical protein